jgi:hypothetical protein
MKSNRINVHKVCSVVTRLACTWDLPGSNFGHVTGYVRPKYMCFFLCHFKDSILKQAMTASFPNISS